MTGVMVTEWDARAEWAIGRVIDNYLKENPPPADALFPEVLAVWARQLKEAGVDHLVELDARPLVVA